MEQHNEIGKKPSIDCPYPLFIDNSKVGMLSSRTRRGKPLCIVTHHTCTGTANRTFDVLSKRNLSTHYEIDQGGQVYQYLDPENRVASHVGAYNEQSIGIDLTHLEGEPFTSEQMISYSILVKWLCGKFNITQEIAPEHTKYYKDANNALPTSKYGVYRHSNLAATRCPDGAPMEIYLNSEGVNNG